MGMSVTTFVIYKIWGQRERRAEKGDIQWEFSYFYIQLPSHKIVKWFTMYSTICMTRVPGCQGRGFIDPSWTGKVLSWAIWLKWWYAWSHALSTFSSSKWWRIIGTCMVLMSTFYVLYWVGNTKTSMHSLSFIVTQSPLSMRRLLKILMEDNVLQS